MVKSHLIYNISWHVAAYSCLTGSVLTFQVRLKTSPAFTVSDAPERHITPAETSELMSFETRP